MSGLLLRSRRRHVVTPPTPSPGGTVWEPADATAFQDALDDAALGDIIILDAGTTYQGKFTLPVKTGSDYLTIQSSEIDQLPAGVRVQPSDVSHMATIQQVQDGYGGAAVLAVPGSHHYRFQGIAFKYGPTAAEQAQGAVMFGNRWGPGEGIPAYSNSQTTVDDVPHHLDLDRCYIYGDPNGGTQRGVELHCAYGTVKNCYLSDFKREGIETQAIHGCNGPGPYLIENNYIEAAGENIMFGGALILIPDNVPSDITIRGNHFFKPLSWKIGDPTYNGTPWNIKNLLEFKCAQRVVVEDNTFENMWIGHQTGYAIIINTQTEPQDGTNRNPWVTTSAITIRRNIIKNCANGIAINGRDQTPGNESVLGTDFTIRQNLFWGLKQDSDTAHPGESDAAIWLQLAYTMDGLTVEHNTAYSTDIEVGGRTVSISGTLEGTYTNLVFRSNAFRHQTYGMAADSLAEGLDTLNTYWPSSYTYTKNVIGDDTGSSSYYTGLGCFFPTNAEFTAQFTDPVTGDFSLIPSSPYKDAAHDGTDIGVDMSQLADALAAVQE